MKTIDDVASGSLDVHDASFWDDPYVNFAEARRHGWLFRSSRGYEVVTYDQTAALLRNPNLGHDHVTMATRAGIKDPDVLRFRRYLLVNTVGADHVRLRTSVGPFFGAKNIESLRGEIRKIITRIFDEVEDPENVNLLRDVCARIPAQVYMHAIGMDPRDREIEAQISSAGDSIMKILREEPAYASEIEQSYGGVFALVDRILESRRRSLIGGDDLITYLLRAERSGTITPQEAFDLAAITLEASVDNTYTQMALTLSCLWEIPEAWNQVRGASGDRIGGLVEEGIRYRPRTIGQRRTARQDFELAGAVVPEGTEFFLSVLSSHRDAKAYADPDIFDIDREVSKPTVMFGGGMTACLGSGLARVEMQEFFRLLVERYPHASLREPWSYAYQDRTVCCPSDLWVSLV